MELGLAGLVGLRSVGYRRGILDVGGFSVFCMVILAIFHLSSSFIFPFDIKRAPSLLFSFAGIYKSIQATIMYFSLLIFFTVFCIYL